MKTHLPVALRKALLVAIVAVSAFAYNKADAAVVIALPDPAQKTLEQGLADSSADIMAGDDGQIEIIDGTRAGSSNSVTWKNIENDTLDFSSDELNDKVSSVSLLSAFNGTGNTVRTGDASITAEAGVGGSQNTLETDGGDIEVTTVSGSENQLMTSGDGNISVGLVQGDHTSISTESGSISIQNVAVVAGKDYQESLKVTSTNGSVTVGVSEALLHDVKIDVGGTLTLGGDTAGREEVLSLRGYGDDSNLLDGNNEITTHIKADGGITVNQSLLFSPGMDNNEQDDDLAHLTNKGRSVMESAGDIKFLGATTRIVGGNNGTGTLPIDTTVCGSTVSFVNEGGTDISADSVVKSTEGSISIQDGNGEVSISGTLISAEDIHIDGGLVQMLSDTPVPSIENNVIPQGIAALVAQGDVVVDGDDATISWRTYINGAAVTLGNETSDTWVWASTIISTEEEIAIYGADVTVQYSNIDASLGKVYIGGDECTTDINGGTVDGAGDVTVSGTDVTISDAASIDSRNGKVTIAGTNTGITGGNVSSGTGDVAISGSTKSELDNVVVSGANVGVTGGEVLVTGERVTGTGLVQIAGATSTGVKGVDVDGGSVSIGSGTGTTTIASANEISTTIDATGDITVRDAKVELEENSVITSEQGNIEIAATGSDLSVIGGSVTTGQGTIAISGATSTVVDGAELGVADGSDAVVGVRIGQPGVGETTVDGSTIDATGEIKVEGAATGIGNGSELQADAGILINSAGAGITDGSLINDSSVSSSAGDIVINSVKSSRISGESVIEAETGSVTMESSYNAIQDSVVIAGADVTMISEKNVVVSITAAATIEAGGSVTMQGNNLIYRESKSPSGVSIVAEQGDITVAGDNFLGRATLQAGGAVRITTSEEGVATREKNDIEHVEVLAGEGISVISEDSIYGNSIKDSSLTAVNDDIAIESKTSSLVTGSELVARNGDVSVSGGVASVADSSIAATGSVEIEATKGDATVVETEVTASRGDVSISGATGTSVSGAVVSSAGAVAIGQSDAGATIVEDSSIAADGQVSVLGASVELKDSKGINTESSVVVSAGNGDVAMSGESVNAGKDVTVAAVNGDVSIASEVKSVDGSVSVTADGSTNLTGDTVAATEGSVTVSAGTDNTIDSAIAAGSDVTVTAGGNNTLSAEVTSGGEIAISAGAMNSIAADVKAANGSVAINGGTANVVEGTETTVAATNGAVQLSGGVNLVDGATLKASGEASVVSIAGESNVVRDGASIQADAGVSISSTGQEAQSGNLISASSVQSADGDIVIKSENINRVSASSVQAEGGGVSLSGGVANVVEGSETKVSATGGSIELKGGAVVNNQVDGATLEATGEGAAVSIAGASNVISRDAAVKGEAGVSISSTGTDSAAGNVISGSVVASSSGDVAVSAANINLVDSSSLESAAGDVTLAAESNLVRHGSTVESADGIAITSTGEGEYSGNGVSGARLHAAGSFISITAEKNNHVCAGSAITADAGSVALSSGLTNVVEDSALSAGPDVNLTATEKNEVRDSTVSAGADVSMVSAENVVSAVAADTTVKAAGSVSIQGDNAIYSAGAQTSIVAEQGDITVAGSNDISRAELQAGGAVRITTGEGDMTTRVENATLTGSSVTIAGDTTSRDAADLAVVTGEDMLVTAGSITLNNVSVVDTGSSSISATEGGNISILDRVDMQNATLMAAGHIVVDAGHVLNAGQGSSLQGRLSGSGDINKSGGDALVLSGDNTAFSGTIYANGAVGGAAGSVVDEENAGSWIEMNGAGVGAESAMVLKNTDLIVNSAEAQIGTLDTTQDAAANNAATGGTLLADGSYTTDDNTRTDFTTVGSVLEVQQGTSGNVLHASGMKLSDATLIKLDAEVGADGQASSDIIKVSGSIDMAAAQTGNSVSPATAPVTARVFVNHLGDAASAAEGARTTIMEGTVASALNEDVLYEVTRSANGTYQRVLQERNVHLENKGDRVDLVYSKNYRSAAKNAQQTAVAGVLQQLSDNFHHSEGTLAASGDTTARLIDAFDYTRSEAAAVRGLQSVAGSGNVLPRLMQFDSSRHHLANLRRQMALPVCPRTDKGGVNRTRNTWITYTGAQDDLGGDAYMGDYSRSAHGFLLGADRSLTCNLRVGASLGYETASGDADLAKVDGDTLFLDAYAVAVTGQLRHRVSFGLASSSFDSKRGVAVDAGYHSFSGQTKSSADGLTLNFGYELSVEQQLNARSSLARYLSVNLSWHKLDAMKEDGLGNMGLETSYDDEWQADVALGLQYNREFTAVRYEAPATFYATAELHLDLLNDRLSARNRFHGPAADWEVKSMKRDTLYVEFGAGVIVPLSPSWTATAGAAVEVGSEHTSFSGNAGVRYSF